MKRIPSVSVVIPTYNDHRHYVVECLESLIQQSLSDWEAIVVDDGSDDAQGVEADVRRTRDSRVRYIRHAVNRGLSAARNTGLRAATGPLVAMVDSDDRVEPQFLEVTCAALHSHQACDAAYGDFRLFGTRQGSMEFVETTRPGRLQKWKLDERLESFFLRPETRSEHKLWQVTIDDLEPSLQLRFLLPPGAGVVFRRTSLERLSGYCEAQALSAGLEDWDFWLGAASAGFSVIHLAQPLYCYRQHSLSMISKVAVQEYRIRKLIYEQHKALIDRLGLRSDFLATGYRRSAKANWFAGNRTRAALLALRALALSPSEFWEATVARKRTVL